MLFRIAFGFLASVVAAGMVEGGQPGVFGLIVLTTLVLGALYLEEWSILPTERRIVSRHGLLVLARTRRWSFDEIEAVEYTHYRAGVAPGVRQPPPPDSDSSNDAAMDAMHSGAFGRPGRRFQRHFLRYSLVLTDGTRVRIEIRRVREWKTDFALPTSLADALGVPLIESSM